MARFKIEILTENQPFEQITELLHASYREHLEEGRNYKAATQTVEDTKQRLQGRYCIVAYNEENRVIATIAIKRIDKNPDEPKKWYEDDHYVYIEQMAVHPDYRASNVFSQMFAKTRKEDWLRTAESWVSDTSCEAGHLVDAYVRMGFQIVELVSWPTTNYYSYIFRRPTGGKKYSDRYIKFKFTLSSLACKFKYSKNGKKRF